MEEQHKPEVKDRVIHIGRVVKVVKGGRRFSFNALAVAGDGNGSIGWGLGKANEVPEAIRKATAAARKKLYPVNIHNNTIPHDAIYKFGSSKVMMYPAPEGVGIIAGGAVRAVMELAGVQDVVTKCHGSTNPHNVLKAAIGCLRSLDKVGEIFARRGKEAPELSQHQNNETGAAV
jgi:small subunit ribosomal protein S5